MDDELIGLLEYDGVLGAVATSPDGLVVGAAGLTGDDAEILGAAGSLLFGPANGSGADMLNVGSGAVHVVRDDEVYLVVLAESSVPHDAVETVMIEALGSLAEAFG